MWLGSPSTAQAATSPPTARRAKYPCRPRRVASARAPTLALAHNGPDIGRGARPSAPHAHARLGCWTPRRAPRRGRAAGDVGPYHSPTRTHLAPTVLPPAPTWPLPFSRPHPLGPYHCPTRTHVGPYHSPTRTHSAPTLAPQRPGARSTRAAPGAWRPNASGPVRWSRREGRNSVRPYTQARRRPGRHGGPGSGQPPLRAHGAHGVRFQCVIKSYSWPES